MTVIECLDCARQYNWRRDVKYNTTCACCLSVLTQLLNLLCTGLTYVTTTTARPCLCCCVSQLSWCDWAVELCERQEQLQKCLSRRWSGHFPSRDTPLSVSWGGFVASIVGKVGVDFPQSEF
eukprot:5870555-Amphidinium_carterae.1